MIRCITIIKITTRRVIEVTVIIRNSDGDLNCYQIYYHIVGISTSRVRTFTKTIIVIIKIIT